MNSYIYLLPTSQTPCPGCPSCPNPLPSVPSSSPATPRFVSIFFLFPKTVTAPTQQHHEDVLPSSSSSSPTQWQQHHEDAALCLLPQTTKTQSLALRLLDHDLLPSTRHRTKDEDYRLRQWWISSTEPLFKSFWKGHGFVSNLHGFV